jgi:hypothetical protein
MAITIIGYFSPSSHVNLFPPVGLSALRVPQCEPGNSQHSMVTFSCNVPAKAPDPYPHEELGMHECGPRGCILWHN